MWHRRTRISSASWKEPWTIQLSLSTTTHEDRDRGRDRDRIRGRDRGRIRGRVCCLASAVFLLIAVWLKLQNRQTERCTGVRWVIGETQGRERA